MADYDENISRPGLVKKPKLEHPSIAVIDELRVEVCNCYSLLSAVRVSLILQALAVYDNGLCI